MSSHRYVVTGGLGFIGNEVVRQIRARGEEVVIFDNRSRCAPRIEDLSSVPVIEGSILDGNRFAEALAKVRPTAVIHLAAMHYIPECNAHPADCMNINVAGTIRVAQAAQAHGVQKFIFASSGAVYADSAKPLSERSLVEPIDVYGLSKHSAEIALRLLQPASPMQITIGRFFNNYGPRETNAHIIPEILSQLKKGRVLSLGNIDTKRDFILTEDTARTLIDLSYADLGQFEILNVGSGKEYSMREVIECIAKFQGTPIKIEVDKARYRKADKENQVADISRLKEILNWAPSTSLEQGLTKLLTFEAGPSA